MAGIADRVGTWLRQLRDPAVALMAAACLFIGAMYACNHDMGDDGKGGDDLKPRGAGVYRPVLARGDGHMLYLMTLSTVFDRDWRFDDELARFGDPWGQPITATGRKGIPHPIGPALVWSPALVVAAGSAGVANVLGAGIPTHGYTPWHQRIVFFTSVLFGCGAVLLGRRVAGRVIGGRWAPTYAAVAILVGSSLAYYAAVMPSYGHAMDAFFCAAFLACWASTVGRDDLRRHVGLGLLLGVAALIRMQELAMGLALAVEVVARGVGVLLARDLAIGVRARRVAGLVGRGALTLFVAFLTFLPQLAMWKIVYGTYSMPQGDAYTRWGAPLIAETLWSARNGWLVTTPVVYLALIGLLTVPKRARIVGAGLIAVVLMQVYLNSVIMDWWGQASYGNRRLCSVTLPMVVGLAALFRHAGRLVTRWRRPPIAAWHVVAMALFGPLLWWNLHRVWLLNGGKPAPVLHEASCCEQVPRRLRGVARGIYGAIGNPFELPASAVYAVAHDTSLQRWDQTVGDYPIILQGDLLAAGTWRKQKGTWDLASPKRAAYLLDGFGPIDHRERPFRSTGPRARALVPNLIPAPQRYQLWLAPGASHHVRLRWAGTIVVERDLQPGWQLVGWQLAQPGLGSRELAIESAAGVEVGALEISFVR